MFVDVRGEFRLKKAAAILGCLARGAPLWAGLPGAGQS